MAFPALSTTPLVSGYEDGAALDPVIRSPKETGYVQTRPRFTRVPRKWHVTYGDLSDADEVLLRAWEVTVKYGADSDTWTHPKSGTSYTVRLAAPIKYRLSETDSIWMAEFDLEQV